MAAHKAQISPLATLTLESPMENTQRWKEGCEIAFSRCFKLCNMKMSKGTDCWGYRGVFIPPLQKLAVGVRGARKLWANIRILRTLRTQRKLLTVNRYPKTPRICPDTPDFVSGHSGPGVSGLTRDTLKNIILKWFLWLTSICMGFLEHLF
jgi:hypothetical protein